VTANRYAIIVFWSEDDRAWVADVPDLKSCAAFGSTPDEAFAEVRIAMDCSATIMMAAYRQLNWPNRAVVE
jgi:predicted RNase H-like HicB family nuclease